MENSPGFSKFFSELASTPYDMDWSHASSDEIDRGFDHFGGLNSASAAELCRLIRVADVSQTWMRDGARNLIDWVSARLRVRHETARLLVGVAKRLEELPILSARFAEGDLSLDQVDAVSRMATADTEEGLIEDAIGLSNSALDRVSRRANPPCVDDEGSVYQRRSAHLQWNLDQSELNLRANLPGAEGEIVQKAMENAADRIPVNPETGLFDAYPQRLADGLVELAATTGDTSTPPQVTVFADLEALTTDSDGVTELEHGGLIPNETARRLGCDCVVETVITDGSQVVGVGRNSRTIPGWLRRLVHHRDGGGCRFPGCRHARWLQVHHIQHWADSGTTDLDNLILLCGFHHRFLHEHHWHITTSSDGQFQFRRPDWTLYPKPNLEMDPRLKQLVGARPI